MAAAVPKRATLIGVATADTRILICRDVSDRVSRWVLITPPPPLARRLLSVGSETEDVDRFLERTRESWGTGGVVDVFSPSAAADERYRQWWAKYQRMSASPGRSTAMAGLIFDIDVRPALAAVHVPTLVMHRRDFRFFPIDHGRYLAAPSVGRRSRTAGADASLLARPRSCSTRSKSS